MERDADSDTTRSSLASLVSRICRVYGQVLGVSEVSDADDFFALGGNSFSAMRLSAHLKEDLGFDVRMRLIFRYPTPEALSRAIEDGLSANELALESPSDNGHS